MRHPEKTNNETACHSTTCHLCALCKAVNYEEKRPVAKEAKPAIKALYGAEAASYYFFFSPEKKAVEAFAG